MSADRLMTILEMWEQFERETIPKGAPPIQIQEMRLAFYAGFAGMMDLLADLADSGLTDLEAEAQFDSLGAELVQFALLIKKSED